MTPRSLICFSLLFIGAIALNAANARGATVSGQLTITQRAQAHEPLSDIVVWLQPATPGTTEWIQPGHAQLLQKDKMFHPHVTAVTVGTVVDFPNADPIYHNAFSNFEGQVFDIGLYPPGSTRSIRFRRPGIVRVFCNIHPTMSAVILVLNTPFFTKAGPDGRYQMANVPPGVYELRVFDERATAEPDVNVTVTVTPGQSALSAPTIRLSELGYVRQPHKNKYGLDYPPSSTDTSLYSGVPQ